MRPSHRSDYDFDVISGPATPPRPAEAPAPAAPRATVPAPRPATEPAEAPIAAVDTH
jgi:hypothetical protein